MTLIAETVRKEKTRIEYMISEYEKQLAVLPKGTIYENHNGNNTYYYLKYRDGKKIISRYISNEEYNRIQNDIYKRKHIEEMLKNLKNELKFANKALGVKA